MKYPYFVTNPDGEHIWAGEWDGPPDRMDLFLDFLRNQNNKRFLRNQIPYNFDYRYGQRIPLKQYTSRDAVMTAIVFKELPPRTRRIYHMMDMDMGEVFKTQEGKVMMRVSLCLREDRVEDKFTVVNLQTGKIWCPSEATNAQMVIPLKAEMTLEEFV